MTETGDWALSVPGGYRVGRWVVGEPLGAGSWGGVYAGRPADADADAAMPARVAIKFLPTRVLTARSLRHLAEMADREAAAVGTLAHPRLVAVHEVIVVEDEVNPQLDGSLALVMERAERSLADPPRPGERTPGAAALILGVCEGLAYMHARGWIHGDLKPGNVLLMADGTVRLADFGLTAELEGTHAYLPPLGSPEYEPPERRGGGLTERGLTVRPAADVWALGVTAHRLLTGRSPFPGSTARERVAAATAYAAGSDPLLLGADLDPGWAEFVEAALARGPEQRPSTAELLGLARTLAARPGAVRATAWRVRLESAGPDPTTTAPIPPTAPPPRTWLTGRRLTAIVGVLAPLALVGVLAGRASGPTPAEPPWFTAGSEIPTKYRDLIVAAGTSCVGAGVTPLTVAAILAAESGFDPDLSDPAADEYGIARWTPSVLAAYLPPGAPPGVPTPPFPPEVSIPAVGRYACVLADRLVGVRGDAATKIGVAYQSSARAVREQGLRPAAIAAYADRLRAALDRYRSRPVIEPALEAGCRSLCVYAEPGFAGPPGRAGQSDRPAASVVNNSWDCVLISTGPDASAFSLQLGPAEGVTDLRGTVFENAVVHAGRCAYG